MRSPQKVSMLTFIFSFFLFFLLFLILEVSQNRNLTANSWTRIFLFAVIASIISAIANYMWGKRNKGESKS
jgi:hypothetical protein